MSAASRRAQRKKKRQGTDADSAAKALDPEEARQAVAIRAKTLPFMDGMMTVTERLKLHEAFKGLSASASMPSNNGLLTASDLSAEPADGGMPVITAYALRRRYPRFCGGLSFTEELVATIQPRSDVWLMNMIEGSYEDAIDASYKHVSAARKRRRCGLQLGSLDAFSLVTARFIARIYSVLEVRNRICVELLVTLEASKAKGNPMNSLIKNDSMIYDTDRVNTFSKFLAEEWDLDYLSLYLHNRDIIQNHFNIKFRELAMQGVRSPDDPFDYPEKLREILLSQLRASEQFAAKALLRPLQEDRPALPPVPLAKNNSSRIPSSTGGALVAPGPEDGRAFVRRSGSAGSIFVEGAGPEAAAEGGESREAVIKRKKKTMLKPLYISESKEKVVPIALPPTLYFVPDSGLPEAPSLAFHAMSLPVCCEVVLPRCHSKLRKYLGGKVIAGIKRRLESVAPVRPGENGINIDEENVLVPISVFLFTVCEEWRQMPQELREKFGTAGKSVVSLGKLNDVYASNCQAQKERLEEIKQAEIQLSQCSSTIATLDKAVRRCERRWKDNRRHATDEELNNISNLRLSATEEQAKR